MTSQYLTVTAIIWYHPIHPKSQYDRGKQPTKRRALQEQYNRTPQISPPRADEIDDGADTDHHIQPDADNRVEQIDPTPTNPRSSKYDLRHNPRPNCNDEYRY